MEGRGGFEAVCKSKKWAEIGRDLGYGGKVMSSLSTNLKNTYQRWLQPYENYLQLAKPGVQQQLEMEYGGPFIPTPQLWQMSQKASDSESRNQTLNAQVAERNNNETSVAANKAIPSTPRRSTRVSSNSPAGKNEAGNNASPTRKSKRVSEQHRQSREFTADSRNDLPVKREVSHDSSGGGLQTENDETPGRRSKRLKRGIWPFE